MYWVYVSFILTGYLQFSLKFSFFKMYGELQSPMVWHVKSASCFCITRFNYHVGGS